MYEDNYIYLMSEIGYKSEVYYNVEYENVLNYK